MRYLWVVQGHGLFTSKGTYDFVLPIIGAAAFTLMVYFFDVRLGIFADNGLTDRLLPALNLLIPFFIAALASVATFSRDGLDDYLKGEPATIKLLHKDGRYKTVILSNRQFLCYLFGYLTFSALLSFGLLLTVSLVGRDFFSSALPTSLAFEIFRIVSIFFLFAWLFQLLILMFLGLYFLTDRLQFLDRKDI